MTRGRVVFGLLLLLGLLPPGGAAVTRNSADCAATDPENAEQVYACMSSFRRGNGNRNAFANIAVQDCRSIRMNYLVALTTSGLTREDAKTRVPSCSLFARIAKEMTGQEPYWSGCLEFGSLPVKDHLARCLDRFIPGYYGGGRAARKLQGCGEILGAYEQGLRAASGEYPLPNGYTRPDCALVAEYLGAGQTTQIKPHGPGEENGEGQGEGQAPGAGETNAPASAQKPPQPPQPAQKPPQWAQCLNYDPANLPAHLRLCLGAGPDMRRMKDCRQVQAAYTARLLQAYGRLPENHLILPCSVGDGYLAEFRAQEEAEKQAALERQKQAQQAQRAALIQQIEDLRDNPPSRPFYAQPWVTWLFLLSILGGIGWGVWRFIDKRRTNTAQAA